MKLKVSRHETNSFTPGNKYKRVKLSLVPL
jgi:hypothetical protein